MGFKKIDPSLNFADFILADSLKHNRSLIAMEKMDKAINWARVESILLAIIPSAQARKGQMPILLCFCLNACCYKNGSISTPILNSKTRLTIASLLKSSSPFPSVNMHQIILLSHALDPGCLKKPWIRLIPKSSASLKVRALPLMKALLSMPGLLNPPAIPSVMIKLKNI